MAESRRSKSARLRRRCRTLRPQPPHAVAANKEVGFMSDTIMITGIVREKESKIGLPGLIVRAYDVKVSI